MFYVSLIVIGIVVCCVTIHVFEIVSNTSILKKEQKITCILLLVGSIMLCIGGIIGIHRETKHFSEIVTPIIQEKYPNAINYEVNFKQATFVDDNITYKVNIKSNINDEDILVIKSIASDNDKSSTTTLYNLKNKKEIKENK